VWLRYYGLFLLKRVTDKKVDNRLPELTLYDSLLYAGFARLFSLNTLYSYCIQIVPLDGFTKNIKNSPCFIKNNVGN